MVKYVYIKSSSYNRFDPSINLRLARIRRRPTVTRRVYGGFRLLTKPNYKEYLP